MTIGQGMEIAGLNLYVLRILIFFGWVRLIFRGELHAIKLNPIDTAIIWWTIFSIITYTLFRQSLDAFVNRLGLACNTIGLYFLFRFIILDRDDIERSIKLLCVIIVPLAIIMIHEKNTGINIFSVFGGVPTISQMREGIVRCQGPFRHPIMAGTFGVTLMPLFMALWFKGGTVRLLSVIGLLAANLIALTANSSGPIMTYLAIVVGLVMWKYRCHLRTIRWGIFFSLVFLHIIMKAPVWFLIDRAGDLAGSSGHGWYRSAVIDRAIKHFDEWWLLGTDYTAHWGLTILPLYSDKVDITNHIVNIGVEGGLISMILFILIITCSFRAVGQALEQMKDRSFYTRMSLWCLGVALLGHTVSFISVSYLDQMIVSWNLLLAMISAVTYTSLENAKTRAFSDIS